MSNKKAPKSPKNARAVAIADKIGEQVRTLITRDWPQISAKLDEDEGGEGEIKISFGVTIRDRAAVPGEQAEKDNSIRCVMSFSSKFSDSLESEIPDASQMELVEQPEEQPSVG